MSVTLPDGSGTYSRVLLRSPRVAVDPPRARKLRKASESGRNGQCHGGKGKTHKNCHGVEGKITDLIAAIAYWISARS